MGSTLRYAGTCRVRGGTQGSIPLESRPFLGRAVLRQKASFFPWCRCDPALTQLPPRISTSFGRPRLQPTTLCTHAPSNPDNYVSSCTHPKTTHMSSRVMNTQITQIEPFTRPRFDGALATKPIPCPSTPNTNVEWPHPLTSSKNLPSSVRGQEAIVGYVQLPLGIEGRNTARTHGLMRRHRLAVSVIKCYDLGRRRLKTGPFVRSSEDANGIACLPSIALPAMHGLHACNRSQSIIID